MRIKTSIAELFEGKGFFSGLSEPYAEIVAGLAMDYEVKAGELLFRHGEAASRFYLVTHGRVAIELYAPGREPIVVEHIENDDVVGWSWLVAPYRWNFDARAVEPSSLIGVDAPALRARCNAEPAFGYEILRRFIPVMAHRLSNARERLVESVTERK
jgi:CRP-like cAMP-binding protein